MASIGHVALGLALGRLEGSGRPFKRLAGGMALFAALAMLPDADGLSFKLGIPYAAPWGHRGATHSLAFALATALAVAGVTRLFKGPAARLGLFALLAVASHPLLDAMTDGGLGVALLWPFSDARYFLPWRPLPVAPIGLGMLSARGVAVMMVELICFLPLWVYALRPLPERED
jgi:inner membrane protein